MQPLKRCLTGRNLKKRTSGDGKGNSIIVMTYRAVYQEGEEQLKQADITEASLDARLLLEYTCGTDRNHMILHGEQEIADNMILRYRELIRQRAAHIPLQYLTNRQDFMGLSFYVDENVLIPRQDTEILVEEIMKEQHDGKRILEIGTGSGCIILSLLKYSNSCQGTASDISEEALSVARRNAESLGIDKDIINFVKTDIAVGIEGKFDIIVSNPPYIETDEIKDLMPEVRDHEPVLALDGGRDGLQFYERILKETKPLLAAGGKYYFEIGCRQGEALKNLFMEHGYNHVRIIKDYAGLDRVVCGERLYYGNKE